MTAIAVAYYRLRGRLAEHRDYGHALIPWIAQRRRQQ